MKYILALDQGTTSSRAIVFDEAGRIVSKCAKEFKQIYPQPGWVEHDPQDILDSQFGAMEEAIAAAGIDASRLEAIGITNQRETTVVWDAETGKPVYNAIVWQCRRTADECDRLLAEGYENLIYEKTGLIPDAYFSATKVKWILDNVAGARANAAKGRLRFGTVDAWLLWNLTGGKSFRTDYTNASRTMLFNIHSLKWDKDLLEIFSIPECMLPEVCPSGHEYGRVAAGVAEGAPVFAMAGDQQAALFGQLAHSRGQMKNTYGTGCFLLMHTGDEPVKSTRGLLTTLAAGVEKSGGYALEGSVFVGGAAIQWLRDEMRIISSAAESESYALKVPDSGGVYVVPAFVGLGAPHWAAHARGTVTGITRGTTREHFVRATLESIAYQVFDVMHAMERDTGTVTRALRVDGGASANDFLMQFQADISSCDVVRPAVNETTALGAAYLAGLTSGYYPSAQKLKTIDSSSRIFRPSMSEERRRILLQGWEEAVGRAKYR